MPNNIKKMTIFLAAGLDNGLTIAAAIQISGPALMTNGAFDNTLNTLENSVRAKTGAGISVLRILSYDQYKAMQPNGQE